MSIRDAGRMFVVLAALAAACGNGTGPSNGGQQQQQQFGTVSGSVTEGGTGVSGATLQLSRTGAASRTETSGADGAFTFSQVAVGSWTLAVTAPSGFSVSGAATSSVNVTANQTATANFQLQRETTPPQTGTVEVSMAPGNAFDPPTVTIAPGSTVRWRNEDSIEHNTTGPAGTWASTNLGAGATFERAFPEVGNFDYTCTLHPGMNGTVRVQAP